MSSATDDEKVASARETLLALREELSRLDAQTQPDRAPVELDQTSVGRLSRMDAIRVQAMAVAGQQRRRAEIARIDAAIRRLDLGDYGFCIACGEAVAAERLSLDPAASHCVGCAK